MAERSNLKLLLGYAAFREWRWHAHRNEIKREGQPVVVASNAAFIGAGLFLIALSIPYYMIFASTGLLPLFIVANIFWNLVGVFMVYIGLRGG